MIVIESTMYLDNQGFPGLAGPAANRAFTVHDEFCDWHARQRFGHYAQVWLYAARGGIWHMKGRMGVYLCPLKPRVSWREVLGQHRETGQSGGKKMKGAIKMTKVYTEINELCGIYRDGTLLGWTPAKKFFELKHEAGLEEIRNGASIPESRGALQIHQVNLNYIDELGNRGQEDIPAEVFQTLKGYRLVVKINNERIEDLGFRVRARKDIVTVQHLKERQANTPGLTYWIQ